MRFRLAPGSMTLDGHELL